MFIDGTFNYGDKDIEYEISDGASAVVRKIYGEEKMSRYITFYEKKGRKNLGTFSTTEQWD